MELGRDTVDCCRITIFYGIDGICPQCFFILGIKTADQNAVLHCRIDTSRTNLSASNVHAGVAQHQAVLSTAIDRSRDECRVADVQIGAVDYAERDGMLISDGVGQALATTEDPATVIVIRVMIDPRHQGTIFTHRSAADQHFGYASAWFAGIGDEHTMLIITIYNSIKRSVGTHRAQHAAAVDTAFHDAARHADVGVVLHQTCIHVALYSLTAAVDGAFDHTVTDIDKGAVGHV